VYEALGRERDAARSYLAYVRAAPEASDRTVYMAKLADIRDSIQQQESAK
jgi:hypothetical protein